MFRIGQNSLTSSGVEPFGVDAVQPVGVHPPHALAHVVQVVGQVQHAALAEQDVVVELLRQAFPQLQRVLVDRRALVPQVVRADDRGVAGHVPAGQPAALEHRHVGDAVVLGQVVRRGQAVPAATDDDHVVRTLRFGRAPQHGGRMHRADDMSGMLSPVNAGRE